MDFPSCALSLVLEAGNAAFTALVDLAVHVRGGRRHGCPSTRERTVDEFIAAAGELDLRSASTRVIARTLGVPIGAVQHHHPARADLWLDAFGEVSRQVPARVIEADFERRSADDRVASMTHLLPLDPVRRAEFPSSSSPSGRARDCRPTGWSSLPEWSRSWRMGPRSPRHDPLDISRIYPLP